MSDRFQIKVGVLGNISVGKTTFLNALFRDQFGAVSKLKCTAGVHHYHVQICEDKKEPPKTMFQKFFSTNKKDPRPAEGIHDQVLDADRKNRGSDVHQVHEYHYEVQCPKIVTFEEEIPGGLDLVFVDVPGLNCTSKGDKYKEWVQQNWESFDFWIVLIDGSKFRVVDPNVSPSQLESMDAELDNPSSSGPPSASSFDNEPPRVSAKPQYAEAIDVELEMEKIDKSESSDISDMNGDVYNQNDTRCRSATKKADKYHSSATARRGRSYHSANEHKSPASSPQEQYHPLISAAGSSLNMVKFDSGYSRRGTQDDAYSDFISKWDFAGADDISMLKWFFKDCQSKICNLPSIMVVNKIDDYTRDVGRVLKQVEQVVRYVEQSNKSTSAQTSASNKTPEKLFPVSSLGALGIRIADSQDLEDIVGRLDRSCVEMIANNKLTMPFEQWREMPTDKGNKEVVKCLRALTKEECERMLRKNKFQPLLDFLEERLGSERQMQVLSESIQYQVDTLSEVNPDYNSFEQLLQLHSRSCRIGEPVDVCHKWFTLWHRQVQQAFRDFHSKSSKIDDVAHLTQKVFGQLKMLFHFLINKCVDGYNPESTTKNRVGSREYVLENIAKIEKDGVACYEQFLEMLTRKAAKANFGLQTPNAVLNLNSSVDNAMDTSDATEYVTPSLKYKPLDWMVIFTSIDEAMQAKAFERHVPHVRVAWKSFLHISSVCIAHCKSSSMFQQQKLEQQQYQQFLAGRDADWSYRSVDRSRSRRRDDSRERRGDPNRKHDRDQPYGDGGQARTPSTGSGGIGALLQNTVRGIIDAKTPPPRSSPWDSIFGNPGSIFSSTGSIRPQFSTALEDDTNVNDYRSTARYNVERSAENGVQSKVIASSRSGQADQGGVEFEYDPRAAGVGAAGSRYDGVGPPQELYEQNAELKSLSRFVETPVFSFVQACNSQKTFGVKWAVFVKDFADFYEVVRVQKDVLLNNRHDGYAGYSTGKSDAYASSSRAASSSPSGALADGRPVDEEDIARFVSIRDDDSTSVGGSSDDMVNMVYQTGSSPNKRAYTNVDEDEQPARKRMRS